MVATKSLELLKSYGPPTATEYEVLREKLAKGRPPVRTYAASLLAAQPSTVQESIRLWKPILSDDDAQMRLLALQCLAKWRADLFVLVPDLLEQTMHSNPKVRALAIELLAVHGRDDRVVPALLKVVQNDTDPVVRDAASVGLAAQELSRPGDLPVLRVLLKSESVAARMKAVDSLTRLGPAAGPALDDLLAALPKPPATLRIAVLRAIVAVNPDPSEKIVTVFKNVATEQSADDGKVAVEAIDALAKMGEPGFKALVALLKSKLALPATERVCAGISDYGPKADAVIADMYLLARKEPSLRPAVGDAFVKIGGSAVIKLLCETVTDMYFKGNAENVPAEVRRWGIATMGRFDRMALTQKQKDDILTRLELIIARERDNANKAEARKSQLLIRGK